MACTPNKVAEERKLDPQRHCVSLLKIKRKTFATLTLSYPILSECFTFLSISALWLQHKCWAICTSIPEFDNKRKNKDNNLMTIGSVCFREDKIVSRLTPFQSLIDLWKYWYASGFSYCLLFDRLKQWNPWGSLCMLVYIVCGHLFRASSHPPR